MWDFVGDGDSAFQEALARQFSQSFNHKMDAAFRQDAVSALRICSVSLDPKGKPRRATESAAALELFWSRRGCRPRTTPAAGKSSSPTHWARAVFAKYHLHSDLQS